MQIHNAPDVTPMERAQTVNAGGANQDRESPAEFYHRQKPRMSTDELNFSAGTTPSKKTPAKRRAARPASEPWTPSPMVGAILAVAVALVAVYWVGGLELAMILSLTLLVGLLLYALGADKVMNSLLHGKPQPVRHVQPSLRATGPLSL